MKKIVCLLLAIVAMMAFCACGVKDNVKDIKLPGDEVTAEQMSAWIETIEAREEVAEASNTVPKAQWYKLKMENYEETNADTYSYKLRSSISGKLYVSPFAYECKGKVKVSATNVSVAEGKETTVTTNVTVIIIKGEMFMEMTVETKTEDGTEEQSRKVYEHLRNGFDDLLDGAFDLFDAGENTKFFLKGETAGVKEDVELTNGNTTSMALVEYKKDSAVIKRMASYTKSVSTDDNVTSMEVMRVEIKTCLGTTIRRPGDYYTYMEG